MALLKSFLHREPFPELLPEALRFGDLYNRSKGQNADQHFRFVILIIVEGYAVMGIIQPLCLFLQVGKMEKDSGQCVPLIRQFYGQ